MTLNDPIILPASVKNIVVNAQQKAVPRAVISPKNSMRVNIEEKVKGGNPNLFGVGISNVLSGGQRLSQKS